MQMGTLERRAMRFERDSRTYTWVIFLLCAVIVVIGTYFFKHRLFTQGCFVFLGFPVIYISGRKSLYVVRKLLTSSVFTFTGIGIFAALVLWVLLVGNTFGTSWYGVFTAAAIIRVWAIGVLSIGIRIGAGGVRQTGILVNFSISIFLVVCPVVIVLLGLYSGGPYVQLSRTSTIMLFSAIPATWTTASRAIEKVREENKNLKGDWLPLRPRRWQNFIINLNEGKIPLREIVWLNLGFLGGLGAVLYGSVTSNGFFYMTGFPTIAIAAIHTATLSGREM